MSTSNTVRAHAQKVFKVDLTKIKGRCQLVTKVAPLISYRMLSLAVLFFPLDVSFFEDTFSPKKTAKERKEGRR